MQQQAGDLEVLVRADSDASDSEWGSNAAAGYGTSHKLGRLSTAGAAVLAPIIDVLEFGSFRLGGLPITMKPRVRWLDRAPLPAHRDFAGSSAGGCLKATRTRGRIRQRVNLAPTQARPLALVSRGIMRSSGFRPAHRLGRWRPTVSFWITAVVLLLLSAVAAASRGLAGILITLGSFALLTGLYAIVFERRSWAGLPGRKVAAIVGLGGLVVTVVGGGIPGPSAPAAGDPTANAAAAPAAAQTVAATPAATEAGPARAACSEEESARQVQDKVLVCTMNEAGALVWLDKDTSEKLVANRAAEAAAEKAAAEEAAARKAAAEQAAAEAAEAATAEQAGEERAAAEQEAAAPAAVHPNKPKGQWCEFPPSTPECNSGPKRENGQ